MNFWQYNPVDDQSVLVLRHVDHYNMLLVFYQNGGLHIGKIVDGNYIPMTSVWAPRAPYTWWRLDAGAYRSGLVMAVLGSTVVTYWDPDLAYGGRLGEGELGVWDNGFAPNSVRYYDNVQVSTAPDTYPYVPPDTTTHRPTGSSATTVLPGTPSPETLLSTPFGPVLPKPISDRPSSPNTRLRAHGRSDDHDQGDAASNHPSFSCTPDGPGKVKCHTG